MVGVNHHWSVLVTQDNTTLMVSMLQEELQDIMEELDTDKSGGVDFQEFLHFMTKYLP